MKNRTPSAFGRLGVLFVCDDIGHIAVQDKAQGIQGFQSDVFAVLHAMKNIG